MQQLRMPPRGWQFLIGGEADAAEILSLESLDHRFKLGLRGSAWEANELTKRVAALVGSDVVAFYDGHVRARSSKRPWKAHAIRASGEFTSA